LHLSQRDYYGENEYRRRSGSPDPRYTGPRPVGRRKMKLPPVSVMIFLVILFYVIYSICAYMNTKTIAGYEVKTGSLSTDQTYTAMALRTEEVAGSEYPGYVNYYSREGDRVSVGGLAYTVDESGEIMEQLSSDTADQNILTADDYTQLQSQISDFASGFDPKQFRDTYDFRDTLVSTVQKLSNSTILNDISQLDTDSAASIHKCYAKDTGILMFYTDGDEGKTFDALTADDFSTKTIADYKKTTMENNQLVDTGDPVYKLSTDENWSVAIMTTPDTAKALSDLQYVKVRFLKDRHEVWATVSTRDDGSGNSFVDLSFTNSMVDYVGDRYLKIELVTEEQSGLKVPNTSIVEANFFLVPKDFITVGPSGNKGVMRETYASDGKKSVEFVAASPYSETKDAYYLDQNTLRAGDVLDKTDSTDTFTLQEQAKLTGVYNINKGYADFREVNVLYKNDTYSIVEPNTSYGLSEYDHIVLDASSVTADALVTN
jgi:hypothetical protein